MIEDFASVVAIVRVISLWFIFHSIFVGLVQICKYSHDFISFSNLVPIISQHFLSEMFTRKIFYTAIIIFIYVIYIIDIILRKRNSFHKIYGQGADSHSVIYKCRFRPCMIGPFTSRILSCINDCNYNIPLLIECFLYSLAGLFD